VTWDMWVTDQLAFSNATAAVAESFQADAASSICCAPWQTNFIVLGVVTILLGIMVTTLVRDPVRDVALQAALGKDITKVFEGLEVDAGTGGVNDETIRLVDMKRVCRSRTWLFIAMQGVWGCFPWSSFSFLILWFERMEIQSMLAVVIFACVGGMAAAGGAVGGTVGDYFTKKSLWHFKYSRLLINYASVIMGIPGALIYFLALPYYTWWSYALFSLWFGFSVAWCPGNNAAIMSDLFPQNLHPLVFAMQFWVEGASSAFGPFLCAVINDEVFKAKDLSLPQADFNALPKSRRTELLDGLGMSLLTVCCVGWSMCLLTYSPTWFSYPKESRHIARIEGRPDPSWYGLKSPSGTSGVELPAAAAAAAAAAAPAAGARRVATPLGGGAVVEERDDGMLVVKLDWKLANGSRATLYTVAKKVTSSIQ
jgi:MFS family permease